MDRQKRIVRTSIVGIATNVALVVFKAIVGFLANSIAVVLDAVNNLSDVLSALITIVGMKLASRPADKEHPFGHGRIEYFTALAIAIMVLMAGMGSLYQSVLKIINPQPTLFTTLSLVILAVATVVKMVLSRYVRRTGQAVNSDALIATAEDARFDALVSFSTLVAAAVMMHTGILIDGWLGAAISLIIIKSGIELSTRPLNMLLGKRNDWQLTHDIRTDIENTDGVIAACDLALHNYGPEFVLGQVHIEIDDRLTAADIHRMTQDIQQRIRQKYGVLLTVGIYAVNTHDAEMVSIRQTIRSITARQPGILQTHGLYVDREHQQVSFDIIVDFAVKNANSVRDEVLRQVEQALPGYHVSINIDRDVSD